MNSVIDHYADMLPYRLQVLQQEHDKLYNEVRARLTIASINRSDFEHVKKQKELAKELIDRMNEIVREVLSMPMTKVERTKKNVFDRPVMWRKFGIIEENITVKI